MRRMERKIKRIRGRRREIDDNEYEDDQEGAVEERRGAE